MKIYKKQVPFFLQTGGGGAPGAPVLDPPLIMSIFESAQIASARSAERTSGVIFLPYLNA